MAPLAVTVRSDLRRSVFGRIENLSFPVVVPAGDVLSPTVPTAERKRAHLSNNGDHLERGCSTGPSGEDAVSTCSTTIRRRAALTLGRSMSRWGDHTAPAIGLLGTNVLLEASSGEVLLPLLRHC